VDGASGLGGVGNALNYLQEKLLVQNNDKGKRAIMLARPLTGTLAAPSRCLVALVWWVGDTGEGVGGGGGWMRSRSHLCDKKKK
jgi:hypothetical protein